MGSGPGHRHREILLKGARSRCRTLRAVEERYQGALGLGRLEFRWTNVQVLLNHLHDGLEGGGLAQGGLEQAAPHQTRPHSPSLQEP